MLDTIAAALINILSCRQFVRDKCNRPALCSLSRVRVVESLQQGLSFMPSARPTSSFVMVA